MGPARPEEARLRITSRKRPRTIRRPGNSQLGITGASAFASQPRRGTRPDGTSTRGRPAPAGIGRPGAVAPATQAKRRVLRQMASGLDVPGGQPALGVFQPGPEQVRGRSSAYLIVALSSLSRMRRTGGWSGGVCNSIPDHPGRAPPLTPIGPSRNRGSRSPRGTRSGPWSSSTRSSARGGTGLASARCHPTWGGRRGEAPGRGRCPIVPGRPRRAMGAGFWGSPL